MEDKTEYKSQMLDTNIRQKEYYEFAPEKEFLHGGNFATKWWNKLRGYQYKMLEEIGLTNQIYELHKQWMGDLTNKKVLDLGCHTGNVLSEYLAKNSKEYIAVDLSSSALLQLKSTMEKSGITNGHYISEDILSDDFVERDFDIIYAKAILHHFKYIDVCLERLQYLTKPGGSIITFDPLNTYLPLKIFRYFYRFLQNDKDWEYPFTKQTFKVIDDYFDICNSAGSMGKTKKAFLLYLFSKKTAISKSKNWQYEDLYNTPISSSSFWNFIGVALHLKNSKVK
jgi:2-polyprenyl-3-methyl-5-hydroxy-6-metoxy-1,4-benzoquinol methylase